MKNLVLIRHAQAENGTDELSDFDRALTNSGKTNAVKMARLLNETGIIPQTFISSSALRALTTATIFTSNLNLQEPETTFKIYEANVPALLQVITAVKNTVETIALVGHNPGLSNLLYHLTGKIITLPTCAFAIIELEVDNWSEVSIGTGKLIHYSFP